MKAGRASRTAEAVAAIRAKHWAYDFPHVFSDPWAIKLTSRGWRTICASRVLTWFVFDKVFAALRPVQATVLSRARFVEDMLAIAARKHFVDYVILGAGLDSFALRQHYLRGRLRVWEVDHPSTQARKRRMLDERHVEMPDNLRFIPADLQVEALQDVLFSHHFDRDAVAFFSLLGVSYYLPEEAVFCLVEAIAKHFRAGSELVLDVRVRREFIEPDYLPSFEKTERFTARRGEAMITHVDPEAFIARCEAFGLQLVENLSPAGQRERYFLDREDGLSPSPEIHLLHFRVG